jgi:hypothetical protein
MSLPDRLPYSYIDGMERMRTATRYLRLVVAGLFALLSPLQAPAMVFAWAGAAVPSHHATLASSHPEHTVHHHSHPQTSDVTDGQDLTGDIHGAPLCHSVGCCTGLAAIDVGAPTTIYLSLGLLDAAPEAALVPASPDPADPPPRLQA